MKFDFLTFFTIFCFSLVLVSLGAVIALYAEHHKNTLLLGTFHHECQKNDLVSTVDCLESHLELFYNYNLTNVGKNLNASQLETEGGVCDHYADWYIRQAKANGLYATKVIIDYNETVSHAFAVISNDEGYCIADQLVTHCVPLG